MKNVIKMNAKQNDTRQAVLAAIEVGVQRTHHVRISRIRNRNRNAAAQGRLKRLARPLYRIRPALRRAFFCQSAELSGPPGYFTPPCTPATRSLNLRASRAICSSTART